jgi:hypothetical protein
MSPPEAGGGTGWLPFDNGSSLGKVGSEDGLILRDEAHPSGARLTLEDETFPAPCAITCAVYGWLAHTCHYATEAEAQSAFDAMKLQLAPTLLLISAHDDEDGDRFGQIRQSLESFVERFPRLG